VTDRRGNQCSTRRAKQRSVSVSRITQSEHMTVDEIARILKLNPQTVRNWI
jgi:DNA-binding transcriptional regulator YiaG